MTVLCVLTLPTPDTVVVCSVEHVCNMWCCKGVMRLVSNIVRGALCDFMLSDGMV